MPQDMNGVELKEGDKVLVPCTVRSLATAQEEWGNCSIDTEQPMFPGSQKMPILCNSRQVVKAQIADPPGPEGQTEQAMVPGAATPNPMGG